MTFQGGGLLGGELGFGVDARGSFREVGFFLVPPARAREIQVNPGCATRKLTDKHRHRDCATSSSFPNRRCREAPAAPPR